MVYCTTIASPTPRSDSHLVCCAPPPHAYAVRRAPKQIKGFAFVNAYSISIMLTTPFVMVMLTLVVYFNSDGDFSPDKVFTAVSLLLIIRFPLMMLPMAIASWVQGKVRGKFRGLDALCTACWLLVPM